MEQLPFGSGKLSDRAGQWPTERRRSASGWPFRPSAWYRYRRTLEIVVDWRWRSPGTVKLRRSGAGRLVCHNTGGRWWWARRWSSRPATCRSQTRWRKPSREGWGLYHHYYGLCSSNALEAETDLFLKNKWGVGVGRWKMGDRVVGIIYTAYYSHSQKVS